MHRIIGWAGLLLLTISTFAQDKPPSEPQETNRPSSGSILFEPAMTGLPETGMWKCDPVFCDVNGDGHLDLAAVPRLGVGPHVWLGDGQGRWTAWTTELSLGRPSCGGGIALADVNADDHIDLIVADHCAGAFVFLGDQHGGWEMVTNGLFPSELATEQNAHRLVGAESVAVADLNADGKMDLVVGAADDAGVNVYLGDGTGRQWTRSVEGLPATGWANRVQVADMNADGRPDIIASYSDGPRVWLNDGQGAWRSASVGLPEPMIRGVFVGLAVGDVNQDGRPDIAVANWINGPEVFLQREDGSWNEAIDVLPAMLGGAQGVALGDLDRDGHLDMVVAGRISREGGYVRGVFALRGDGAGGWTHLADCGLPATGLATTAGVAIADFNADGWPDIAAASGLIVETTKVPPFAPTIPARMLAWIAKPEVRAQAK